MTSKQRLLAAINREKPDHLPVTTHHLMTHFLENYADGMDGLEFHKSFGFDPIVWILPIRPNEAKGQYIDEKSGLLCSDDWRITLTDVSDTKYPTKKYTVHTPKKELTTILQHNGIITWQTEHFVKEKSDMEIIAQYAPHQYIDVDAVNTTADALGEDALVRGNISSFQPFGQPGCWQDIACLYGIERLIMEAYDDPEWVHFACQTMQNMKKTFITSLKGARYDIMELGGGDASTTVISPKIFDEFVAPYDTPLVELAHEVGQKIVYHTCGGMMPILTNIADMGVDAMETFTPKEMGADVDLAKAKRIIGDRVCMIGGFDQGHHLHGCTELETRQAVRRCFEQAGENGGFILSPSDHFFDADISLIKAFVDEAHHCTY